MKNLKAHEPWDDEEKELMQAEETGLIKPVPQQEFVALKKELETSARRAIARRKMISIKVPEADLEQLKVQADRQGLRYQSLINSILHQYVMGHLKSVVS